jgi:AcrR family transcriptional regulator
MQSLKLGKLLGFSPASLQNREVELLEAAIRVYVREGGEKFSFERVAAQAGVSRSLLSYYFKSHNEVFEKCVLYVRNRYQMLALDAVKKPLPTSASKLRKYLQAAFDWPRVSPYHAKFWFLLYLKASNDVEWRRKNQEWVKLGTARLSVLVEEGIQNGEWDCADPARAARQLQIFITGALVSFMTEDEETTLARMAEESWDLFTNLVDLRGAQA